MKHHDQSPAGPAVIYAVGEKELMNLLDLALRDKRLSCRTFTNAEVAFEEFATTNSRPVLLITGCLDSDGSGLTLIRKCKIIEPGLKVILWSGHRDEIVASLLAKIPVTPDVIFPKGDAFEINKLLQAADELVSRVSGRDQNDDSGLVQPI